MINHAARYSFSNALIRGMIGDLFSKKNYDELLSAKSIDEIYRYLCNTSYQEALIQNDPGKKNEISFIERSIIDHLIGIYEKVIRYSPKRARRIILFLLREYEIENIKVLVPYIIRGEIPAKEEFIDIHSYSSIDMQDFMATTQFSQLNYMLKKTDFYPGFQQAYQSYLLKNSQFIFDTKLDIYYFNALQTYIKQLESFDRNKAEDLIGFRIDLLNLEWLCRLKLNFKMREDEILTLLLPPGKFLKAENLRQLVKGNDLPGILNLLPARFPLRLPGYFESLQSLSIWQLENKLDQSFNAYCWKVLNGMPFHIGIILAYLFLKQSEVRNIKIILNGKRYQLSNEEIIPYLTLYHLDL